MANAIGTNDDPGRATPVVATPEEIRYAQHLRQQIRERYLRLAPLVVAPWCVGCD